MAKDSFSFDVVSEVDMVEVANALDQARREVGTRFDFKNTGTEITQDDQLIEVRSATEDRLKAALEVVKDKMVKRGVSLKALSEGPIQDAAKSTSKISININKGLSDEKAKEIVKVIKGLGVKVQSAIQGDQVRVTGKKKDDLQQVITGLKEKDLGIPLQFVNMRP
jgi:uncharacterized protein YajQ (UPF0234 family)